MKSPIDPKAIRARVREAVSDIKLPKLGSEADIPVYMVHNSTDPEDYFFLFDFELFVDRSRAGIFVKPKLKIWAGRDDFDKIAFARSFRQTFAREFDRMRADVGKRKRSNAGWLTWDLGQSIATQILSNLVAYVVILLATGAAKALTALLPVPDWLRGKSEEAKVQDRVEALQARVDATLETVEVTLHRDLYLHAWRGAPGGRTAGMDYEAWPLPGHVQAHLEDQESGSWW